LRSIAEARKRFGEKSPIVVIVDERIPIEILRGVGGTAKKARLHNIRYFSFVPDTGYMSEIVFKVQVPFSTAPQP
jgi:hypothetical protein